MFFFTVRLRTIIFVLAIPLVIFTFCKGYEKVWKLIYPFPYRDIITKYSYQNGLDPNLVAAIIRAESRFRPEAESHKGAVGLMQLQPETAAWAAQQMGLGKITKKELSDIHTNVQIGCWYFKSLLVEFDGDVPKALAAYNGGRGNVRQWLNEGIWDGSAENLDQIPFWETRGFVRKVLKSWQVYTQIYKEE